ncbi:flagellar biosynthetic protein FliR [Limnobacter humi]|uniref:Flagellar biosynthetic protein FliR n=1 Tax=Limnobacter humi TaxID=1778671 RepID=A0ABT1WJB7_9BURK|nr:flagellar biosynthetic protein FliR [Limnobacter humi]MCQ8897509.1 flagellar biosynthetic protein FliR [Limnobacter humi]
MFEIDSAWFNTWLMQWMMPFIRVSALLATAPLFDARSVNRRVRIGLAAFTAYLVAGTPVASFDTTQPLVPLVFQQILVGVSLGFFMRVIFAAMEVAGDFIGLQMGLAFAMFIDPQKATTSPMIGAFLNIMATLVFLSMNGHLMAMDGILTSFQVVPISTDFSFLNPLKIAQSGLLLFQIAMQLTLPIMACVLSVNIALGLLSRAAPQFNIMSVGFSITIFAGLALLYLSLPFFVSFFESAFNTLFTIPIWNR